jgi:hypothetical protein
VPARFINNRLFITGFIIFFHRERASFCLNKFPGREFLPYQREIFPIGEVEDMPKMIVGDNMK